jgi:hypothetical protein
MAMSVGQQDVLMRNKKKLSNPMKNNDFYGRAYGRAMDEIKIEDELNKGESPVVPIQVAQNILYPNSNFGSSNTKV